MGFCYVLADGEGVVDADFCGQSTVYQNGYEASGREFFELSS